MSPAAFSVRHRRLRGVAGLGLMLLPLLLSLAWAAAQPEDVRAPKGHIIDATTHSGDKGTYVRATLRQTGQSWTPVSDEAPWIVFAWEDATNVLDAHGHPRPARSVQVEDFGTGPQDDSSTRWFYDVVTGAAIRREVRTVVVQVYAPAPPLPFEDRESEEHRVSTFEGPGVVPPCLPAPAFSPRDLRMPVRLFQDCSWGSFVLGDRLFTPHATDVVDGRPALVLRSPPPAVPDGAHNVYVWFGDGPYPLVVALERDAAEHVFDVIHLAHLAPGAAAATESVPVLAPAPPLTWAPREIWGPRDAEVEHRFKLSDAFVWARDQAPDSGLGAFLHAHPDALVQAADYFEDKRGNLTERRWSFTVTDGVDQVSMAVVQRPQLRNVPVPGKALGAIPISEDHPLVEHVNHLATPPEPPAGAPPRPDRFPEKMPTVQSLREAWRAHAIINFELVPAPRWGFHVTCPDDACLTPQVEISAGAYDHNSKSSPTLAFERDRSSLLVVDETGRALRLDETVWLWTHASPLRPGPPPPASAATLTAVALGGQLVPVPPPDWMWAAGFAALVAGVLLFWGSSLHTRILRAVALHHPARSQLVDLVEANPGIHFQEIVRRAGRSATATSHHLRKLVHLGLLVSQAGPRYTCYFAPGKVDRRAMVAETLLKAPGAQKVLQLVRGHPGLSAGRLAAEAQLDPGTVTYHLRRLREAGIVRTVRVGREVRVFPTDVGGPNPNPVP